MLYTKWALLFYIYDENKFKKTYRWKDGPMGRKILLHWKKKTQWMVSGNVLWQQQPHLNKYCWLSACQSWTPAKQVNVLSRWGSTFSILLNFRGRLYLKRRYTSSMPMIYMHSLSAAYDITWYLTGRQLVEQELLTLPEHILQILITPLVSSNSS